MKSLRCPDFSLEEAFYNQDLSGREQSRFVIGVDEVGRGAMAGPVIAGAFCLTYPFCHEDVAGFDDSKKLSRKKRDMLFQSIHRLQQRGKCDYAIGESSVEEIDQINILQASLRAMSRAVKILCKRKEQQKLLGILVDGPKSPHIAGVNCPIWCVRKGDEKSYTIAGASIVAKVTRDRLMSILGENFSGYGWERNAGYGTNKHLDAMRSLGLTPHHRLSFSWQKAFDHELKEE